MILITGAAGLIGRQLTCHLRQKGHDFATLGRPGSSKSLDFEFELSSTAAPRIDLRPFSTVIHLAGISSTRGRSLNDLVDQNALTTRNLAQAAVSAGIKHFVFASSTKVYGPTATGSFSKSCLPAPTCDYGRSKLQAEHLLEEHAEGMAVSIVRFPPVYGRTLTGGIKTLSRLVGLPVPLGAAPNRRSFLSIDHACSAVETIIGNGAGFQVFQPADSEPISTAELLRVLARYKQKPARIIRVPTWLTERIPEAINDRIALDQLFKDQWCPVDRDLVRLGWQPQPSTGAALSEYLRSSECSWDSARS